MKETIGVIGSGAMGTGIAQVAAQAGHPVIITDRNTEALRASEAQLRSTFDRLTDKGKMTGEQAAAILGSIRFSGSTDALKDCGMIIEAIVEDLSIKQSVFSELERIVSESCLLATNTSSLSVTGIAGACKNPGRVIGIHFFNPAPLLPLVEIIPGFQTDDAVTVRARSTIESWGKTAVVCRDLPGFIVNRIARPFYGEALRIFEEGLATPQAIDAAMRRTGFRMGPFELMDLIGNDVNYAVTESVFRAFYFDPRYKPSLVQKRMVEAGRLGRKTGRGYYDYRTENTADTSDLNPEGSEWISERILTMLINEAYDALYYQVASYEDIELAMTKGVNYPKGLLAWGKELGLNHIAHTMNGLRKRYNEDRYRPSPALSADKSEEV